MCSSAGPDWLQVSVDSRLPPGRNWPVQPMEPTARLRRWRTSPAQHAAPRQVHVVGQIAHVRGQGAPAPDDRVKDAARVPLLRKPLWPVAAQLLKHRHRLRVLPQRHMRGSHVQPVPRIPACLRLEPPPDRQCPLWPVADHRALRLGNRHHGRPEPVPRSVRRHEVTPGNIGGGLGQPDHRFGVFGPVVAHRRPGTP